MRRGLVQLALVPLLAAGCASQRGEFGANQIPAAAVVTGAVAVGASAASRASGGCFAVCSYGTVCNPKTGYCDVLPCRGLCTVEQECDVRGPLEKCVPRHAADLKIEVTPDAPLTPK